MQNVWLKSRTRDVCGRFVVAVSFADGNVRANGACDRVIRVVRCRGNSVAEALRDDARWCQPRTRRSVFAAVPTKNPAIQTSQTIAGHLSKSLLAGQRS